MKKKKANEHTTIGVDSLEVQITSKQRTKIEETEIYSTNTGEKIFTIKSQNETGFRLSICLRASGKIEIHKGAISELVQIFRAILKE